MKSQFTQAGPAAPAGGGPGAVTAVAFDFSGLYLAAGTAAGTVALWDTKADFAHLASLAGHTDAVTGLVWGPHAASLASSSMDRTVKIWQ